VKNLNRLSLHNNSLERTGDPTLDLALRIDDAVKAGPSGRMAGCAGTRAGDQAGTF